MQMKSCDAMEVELIKSIIEYLMVGMGCFVKVQFEKWMFVEKYTDTLLYANLFGTKEILILIEVIERGSGLWVWCSPRRTLYTSAMM